MPPLPCGSAHTAPMQCSGCLQAMQNWMAQCVRAGHGALLAGMHPQAQIAIELEHPSPSPAATGNSRLRTNDTGLSHAGLSMQHTVSFQTRNPNALLECKAPGLGGRQGARTGLALPCRDMAWEGTWAMPTTRSE